VSGYERVARAESFGAYIVHSMAELANDNQKLHDLLEALSIEELRMLADSTQRLNTEAGTWLY
jgi:hypothetical protein